MKRIKISFLFWGMVLTLVSMASVTLAEESSIIGSINVKGSAELSLDGKIWTSIDRTYPAIPQTMFRTSEGKLLFSFNDKTRVELDKNSELAVRKGTQEGHIIEFIKGELIFSVPPGSGLQISTHDAHIVMEKNDPHRPSHKNTVGKVYFKNDKTIVQSISGNILITYFKDNNVQSVAAKQSSRISRLKNTDGLSDRDADRDVNKDDTEKDIDSKQARDDFLADSLKDLDERPGIKGASVFRP
jgi:hypothetical protein